MSRKLPREICRNSVLLFEKDVVTLRKQILWASHKSSLIKTFLSTISFKMKSKIRHKLSIKGVLTNVCSWNSPRQTDADGTEWNGAQIDLILVRGDHVSTLCEMKYSRSEFVVTRDYEERIRERNATFVHFTKTRDAIQTVLVTTYGLKSNQYSGVFYDTVTMDDLFRAE